MRPFRRLAIALLLGLVPALAAAQAAPPPRELTVLAAASLKGPLDGFAADFEKASGIKVRLAFAASSALARQIESGVPAGLFISADLDWMDFAQKTGRLVPGTRVNLLANDLVYGLAALAGLLAVVSLVATLVRSRHPLARQQVQVVLAGMVLAARVPALGLGAILAMGATIPMTALTPVLLRFPPRPVTAAAAYLGGFALGVAAVLVVFDVVSEQVDWSSSDASRGGASVRIALGAFLLVAAVKKVRSHAADEGPP